MSSKQAYVFDIQRYSLHDGPGIRTNVFLKGCPLRCRWCSNPESQKFENEYLGDVLAARLMTAKEVLEVVKKDIPFYRNSGGGMTLTGGEPTAQPDFVVDLVEESKAAGINTAIETAGFQQWDNFYRAVKDIDYILYDIKSINSEAHKEYIGQGNELILDNFKKLTALNEKNILVRVPVIPGFNERYEDLRDIVAFVEENGVQDVQFLIYHALGKNKYEKLGRDYEMPDGIKVDIERLKTWAEELSEEFPSMNIRVS